MYSQAYVRARLHVLALLSSSVAARDRGHRKGVCGKRVGLSEELRLQSRGLDGWKGGRLASKTGRVSR